MDLNNYLNDQDRRDFIKSGLRSILAAGSLFFSAFLLLKGDRSDKAGQKNAALACFDCAAKRNCSLPQARFNSEACQKLKGENNGRK